MIFSSHQNPWNCNSLKAGHFLILLLGFIAVAPGQEQKSLFRPDTSARDLRSPGLEFSLNKPDLLFPTSTNVSPEDFPWFFRQSLTAPLPTLPWQEENTGLQSIWQQELARKREYKTLKTILGSVQAGATGYLLYLHLKKYGLKN